VTPETLPIVVLAAVGLAIGSFLNVCIHRLPRRQSIVRPASRCPGCGALLPWYDNVPVIGYLLLRGRCRSCRTAISPMYPAVELATLAVFLLHYWQLGLDPLLVPRLIFSAALIVLFAIDLRHQILPNVITLPGVVVGFGFSLFLPPGWTASLLGILLGGGSLWLIAEGYYRLRGVEGMGMGDVKMLAMIGAFLGWQLTLVTLMLASILGALVGAGLMAASRDNRMRPLPFGTFLAVAALVASLAGEPLLEWYLSFYR
jgi:leader peptidase (prepilin peptidase) / N-methyltransferase